MVYKPLELIYKTRIKLLLKNQNESLDCCMNRIRKKISVGIVFQSGEIFLN
jgi:hypothetical protein